MFSNQWVWGQNKHLNKANELYKVQRYAEAIPLFQKGLETSNNLQAKVKLANCYRFLNKMELAEPIYAQVVDDEKVPPVTLFYYAEVLMSKGNYADARKWFLAYSVKRPDDDRGKKQADACLAVSQINPLFAGASISAFEFNDEQADDFAPFLLENDLVFISDRKMGSNLLKKKSGMTGRDYTKAWVSKSVNGQLTAPDAMSGGVNLLNRNTGPLCFSRDGNRIFFTRNSDVASKSESFNIGLFSGIRAGDKWEEIELLPFCSPEHNYMHPAVNKKGDLLVFASDKAGSLGGLDLFYSLNTNGKWSKPRALDVPINTTSTEGFPVFGPDDALYFSSRGHGGLGGYDIFTTSYDTLSGKWGAPKNVGVPINSPGDDFSFYVSNDSQTGWLSSNRNTDNDQIYRVVLAGGNPVVMTIPTQTPTPEKAPAQQDQVPSKPDVSLITDEEPSPQPSQEELPATEGKIVHEQPIDLVVEESPVNPPAPPPTPEVLLPATTKSNSVDTVATNVSPVMEKPVAVPATPPVAIVENKSTSTPPVNAQTGNVTPSNNVVTTPSTPERVTSSQIIPDFNALLRTAGKKRLQPGQRYLLPALKFQFDAFDYQLDGPMLKELEQVAEFLKTQTELKLEIGAFTESFGDNAVNLFLSEKRAKNVMAYLASKGVDAGRMQAKGYGESQLLNHCADGVLCSQQEHLQNQRIELLILSL